MSIFRVWLTFQKLYDMAKRFWVYGVVQCIFGCVLFWSSFWEMMLRCSRVSFYRKSILIALPCKGVFQSLYKELLDCLGKECFNCLAKVHFDQKVKRLVDFWIYDKEF